MAAFAAELKRYGLSTLYRDAYGGDWPTAMFAEHGIACVFADKARPSDIHGQGVPSKADTSYVFLEAVPLFSTGKLVLLDHPVLKQELLALERKTGAYGNDKAGKPGGGFDDHAAAAVGALWLCARRMTPRPGENMVISTQSENYLRMRAESAGMIVGAEREVSLFDRAWENDTERMLRELSI